MNKCKRYLQTISPQQESVDDMTRDSLNAPAKPCEYQVKHGPSCVNQCKNPSRFVLQKGMEQTKSIYIYNACELLKRQHT